MQPSRSGAPKRQEAVTASLPERANRIVPVGTMGAAISLRVQSLRAGPQGRGKIETPRSPDPIMRRPCADREEKRGPTGSTYRQKKQEQLDLNGPNQRGLSDSREKFAFNSAVKLAEELYSSAQREVRVIC